MGRLFSIILPVRKPCDYGRTVFHNTPCSRKWMIMAGNDGETGKTIGIMLNSTFSLGVVQKVHLFSREFWNSQIMALWVDNHPCSWTGMIMAGNGWITGKTIGIMLKYHLFPRDYEKNAILGPPKLPSGLRPLGSFGGPRTAFLRPSDGIFSIIPRKKVVF